METISIMTPFADIYLSKQGVHAVTLPQDTSVAVWWNLKEQKWCAVDDLCPHRQVPLSCGVVTPDFNIKCPYHGIEFNDCGTCKLIPSSSMPRSMFKVKSFEVREKYGLLWIGSKNESIPYFEHLENEPIGLSWFVVDENIPQEIMVENSLDVLHADHLHSGMLPIFHRYTGPGIINMKSHVNWLNETGFSTSLYLENEEDTFDIRFIQPYYTWVVDVTNTIFTMHIPINETCTKYVACVTFPVKTPLAKTVAKFFIRIFDKMSRKMGKDIHKQDYDMFVLQNKNIERYGRKYRYAGPGDIGVKTYRRWIKKYN